MKKVITLALAVLLVVGCCSALASCSGKNDTIKIGLSGPLTGEAAVYGTAVANAAQLAVDEINEKGGLSNGLKLELKAMDDAHDPTKIANNYAALSDWGMQVSLGCVTTQPALEFKALSKTDNIFFMTPSASKQKTAAKSAVLNTSGTVRPKGSNSPCEFKIALRHSRGDSPADLIRQTQRHPCEETASAPTPFALTALRAMGKRYYLSSAPLSK